MNNIYKLSSKNWILEKHISKKALPRENIIAWIKWDPNLEPKKITLKLEADVFVTKILNVSEEALKDEKQFELGEVSIDKEHIQIPGFFGFTCFYTTIPDKERTVNFTVEFDFDNCVEKVEYSTKIIRPILQFEEPEHAVTVSPFTQSISPLNFKLKNIGSGRPIRLKPFSDILETPDVKIKIETSTEKNKNENLIFVKTNEIQIPKIIIEGKGYGMISLGYEYEDTMGNSYKSQFANISFNIEEKQTIQVPITEEISKQNILLQATV